MKVYIGYDSRQDYSEDFADIVNPPYQVSKYSIQKHNKNVDVEPIILSELRRQQIYWRGADYLSSTEFVYSRFLTPHLNGYKGIALFCDSDFLWQADVNELLDYYDDKYSVMCVKHNYTPPESTKMDGKAQTHYPRKNWSSCMLWNCEHPSNKLLDLNALNTNDGLWHHRFVWLADNEIGEISHEWNWLTDWYETPQDGEPKMLHYTEGGPWFEHLQDVPYAQDWRDAEKEYQASLQDLSLIHI